MDSKQDIQATGATRGQPTSPPRTTPRLQLHRSGYWSPYPLCAMYVHSPCAVPCLPHDPTVPWTASRTCRLPGPPGGSPSSACHGPHHALNRTGVAADRLTLCAPCMSTVPVQCGACPMTPPCHGHRAGHLGYRGNQGTAYHQPATGRTTPSTAPEWLRPADGWLTLKTPYIPTLPVHGRACPMIPPHHGHQAGHASYLYQEETAHRQPATGHTTPSTATEWLRPAGGWLTL